MAWSGEKLIEHSVLELGKILLATLFYALRIPIFWLVVLLVYLQYRRVAGMEQKLFGRTINSVGYQVAVSTGLGLEPVCWPVRLCFFGPLFIADWLALYLAGGAAAAPAPPAVSLFFICRRDRRPASTGVALYFIAVFPALAEQALVAPLLEIHIPALLALTGCCT